MDSNDPFHPDRASPSCCSNSNCADPATRRLFFPFPAADLLCRFLAPSDAFRLATLLRLRFRQAEAYLTLRPYAAGHPPELDPPSAAGYVQLLDLLLWYFRLVRSARRLRYTTTALWRLRPRYSVEAMRAASERGHVRVLQWWRDCGLEVACCAQGAMEAASANGHVDVLEWWRRCGLPLRFSSSADAALGMAKRNGHAAVVQWWMDSGLLGGEKSGRGGADDENEHDNGERGKKTVRRKEDRETPVV
ncbi:hypothetical protein DFJ73DRAFT_896919 [Zopfochytrium polystomum]|nr:hypothetical protein DFJ73DRAFT_896919 [Zopfochytrium polystomum]